MQLKRTWAEINLDNLIHNFETAKQCAGSDVAIMAVVKANAYGHGAKQVALKLEEHGADWFAVSNIVEACELRRAGVTKSILILGFTPPDMAEQLYANRITQTLLNLEYAQALDSFARAAGVTVNCHAKLDTGMSRIGFPCVGVEETADMLLQASRLANLQLSGLFTHFAVADYADEDSVRFTEKQAELFLAVSEAAARRGVEFKYRHCCNSAGTFFLKKHHLDMVRPGITLYGCSPTGSDIGLDLRPVMTLKTQVVQLKNIKAGDSVGYGREFVAQKDMTVATVPIGYADGYFRSMSGRGMMWLCGEVVSVLGRVCMDQCMLDVTGIPVRCGDEAIVFGGDSPISVDNIAGLSQTNSYEWLCAVSRRVPRVFFENGRVCDYDDYLE